jgi:mevalonate kinase
LIDRNQVLLNGLGVGHPILDTVCKVTAQFGLHSKLTGAGGGGCALTLLSDSNVVEETKAGLEKEGFQCFRAELGGVGVMINTPEELVVFKSLFGKQ